MLESNINYKKQNLYSTRWHNQLLNRNKLEDCIDRSSIGQEDRELIKIFSEKFPFHLTPYYMSLINWEDANDPLRKLVMPSSNELVEEGKWDTSGESESVVIPGLQHKYLQTAVLIVTQHCAAHCRYCFRRRLLTKEVIFKESIEDLEQAIDYIESHTEINNALLSGGDPLVCSTPRLTKILSKISEISHVDTMRISTKIPAFLPQRIIDDQQLQENLKNLTNKKNIIFQLHFDHVNEITKLTVDCINILKDCGVNLISQIAIMKDINNTPSDLINLFNKLNLLGVHPQYIFHPRPVKHATHFQVTLNEGIGLVNRVREALPGPQKRFRYIVANDDGKIELLGKIDASKIAYRWHQKRKNLEIDHLVHTTSDNDQTWIEN
jgi:lysine 2,3-aminomutase